jgi:hypothetical protein
MNEPISQLITLEPEIGAQFPLTIAENDKKYSISDLLPYNVKKKHHSNLNDGLKEYKLLLISAKEALVYYLEGNLSYFDALVGENSCQIRSTLLALIAKQYPADGEELLKDITYFINKIEFNQRILATSQNSASLGDYIENNGLDVKISCREIFLISSYLLTRVRVILPPNPSKRIVRNESTETKKIKEISAVGSSFARDLVKRLRSIVSNISVNFVQEIAETLPIPKFIVDMVSEKYCINHDKFGRLKCLPCFWYTFILMHYSLVVELPLVFNIKQIASDRNYQEGEGLTIYFKAMHGQYREVAQHELSEEAPAIVIMGSCCRKSNEFPSLEVWRKEILNYSPMDLILAYAASHRQYPDESRDSLLGQSRCELLSHYKSKSHKWGCTLENPSLFFLVHAYCDKIKNVGAFSDS